MNKSIQFLLIAVVCLFGMALAKRDYEESVSDYEEADNQPTDDDYPDKHNSHDESEEQNDPEYHVQDFDRMQHYFGKVRSSAVQWQPVVGLFASILLSMVLRQ